MGPPIKAAAPTDIARGLDLWRETVMKATSMVRCRSVPIPFVIFITSAQTERERNYQFKTGPFNDDSISNLTVDISV